MKIIKSLIIASLFMPLAFTSCEHLNVDPFFNDMSSIDSVFSRKAYLERYLWHTATYLPDEGRLFYQSSFPYTSDEMFPSYKGANYPNAYFYNDELDASTGYFQNWKHFYEGIRKTNTILTRLEECQDASTMDKREIIGMTRFLRGYFYFHLLQQYGPFVIVPDEPLEFDKPLEELSIPRSSYDECVEYICRDMEQAAAILPIRQGSTYWTRPTKGAAMALISRVRLYAASPLYNGNNRFYSDWLMTDGQPFINQQVDNRKWGLAAVAAKKMIIEGTYSLHTVPRTSETPELPTNVPAGDFASGQGAGGVDPYRSYADMFNGETIGYKNPEYIFASTSSGVSDFTRHCFPKFTYGWNSINATQKLVDAYYMRDGRTKESSSDEYKYLERGYTTVTEKFSGYTISSGTFNMYANREYRFYATIGFNNAFWPATSSSEAKFTMFNVDYRVGGNAGKEGTSEDRLLSGYTFRKYVNDEDNYYKGMQKQKNFAAIRYAEILLNYVEALNELGGDYTIDGITVSRDVEEIKKYFNLIRYRVGLPGLKEEETGQVALREIILKERMIEFATEGRRYHDLRRWMRAEEEGEPLYGMNVDAKESDDKDQFHTRTRLAHPYTRRSFNRRMYFYPIPSGELDKNPKMIQNPGW